jgi:hypothetical protein
LAEIATLIEEALEDYEKELKEEWILNGGPSR